MFEQLVQRDFVARRGRNNRLLMRSIQRNVFDVDNEEDLNSAFQSHKGQSSYLVKYKEVWLGKRERSPQKNVVGRKRVKFSNYELCLEAHPHLKQYALQRTNTLLDGFVFKNSLQTVKKVDLKTIAESVGLGKPPAENKPNLG